MVTGDTELTRVFRALGDPTRRSLVDLLARGPLPVHALAERFPISRPAISRHLRLLREAGLVHEKRRGRETDYVLQFEVLDSVGRWAAEMASPGGKPAMARRGTKPPARARRLRDPGESAEPATPPAERRGRPSDDWQSW